MHLKLGNENEKKESFNLWKLVEHNIQMMLPEACHKRLQLLCHIDESVPIYFKGLRIYLERTLLNLLSNALKFTNKGYVAINVDVLPKENVVYRTGDKAQLRISVQDSGIGIPKDKLEIIFKNLSGLTPSCQGVCKVSELGLYMVKHCVKVMGGAIWVDSDVGKGSTFTMTFPLIVSDGADYETLSYDMQKTKVHTQTISSSKKNIPEESEQSDSAERILIVEDNLIAAKAVKTNINRLYPSFICDIAENGLRAVQMAQEHRYCFILMDIGLPDIDGIEVTKRIRVSSHRDVMQTAIIALTSYISTWDKKEEAFMAGMQDVFTKPLPPSSLESLMQQYVFKPKHKLVLCKETELIKSTIHENVQVIDRAKCLEQCGGDEGWLEELLSELASDLKLSQVRLEQFYAAHDYNALRAELHRVCGGLAYLTIPQLDKALAEFHKAVSVEPQNPKKLENSYEDLQQAMNAFWTRLELNNT
jgi:two-component system aerobic respiration control sensor histidine kinase ArcB